MSGWRSDVQHHYVEDDLLQLPVKGFKINKGVAFTGSYFVQNNLF